MTRIIAVIVALSGCNAEPVVVACSGTRENIVCECVIECETTNEGVVVTTEQGSCEPICYVKKE